MKNSTKSAYSPTYHRDGTVTYWSVYSQVWVRASHLSDKELAARDSSERARIIRHTSRS